MEAATSGETWELRREARRCSFEASRSSSVTQERMFDSLSRFYTTLALSDPRAGQPALDSRGLQFRSGPRRAVPAMAGDADQAHG